MTRSVRWSACRVGRLVGLSVCPSVGCYLFCLGRPVKIFYKDGNFHFHALKVGNAKHEIQIFSNNKNRATVLKHSVFWVLHFFMYLACVTITHNKCVPKRALEVCLLWLSCKEIMVRPTDRDQPTIGRGKLNFQ